MSKKKELHIKRVTGGYMCCAKERGVWRGYSGTKPTQEEALNAGRKIVAELHAVFLKDICNCGTEV